MFPPSFLLLGLLLPGLIGLGSALTRSRLALALGVGLASSIGLVATGGWPGFRPVEAWGWAILAGMAGGLMGLVELAAPKVVTWALRFVLAQAVVGLVLRPLVPDTFDIDGGALRWSGLTLGLLIVWWYLDALASRLNGPAWAVAWLVIGLGAAVCLVWHGSLRLFQLASVPAAALAGVAVGSLLKGDRERANALGPLASVLVVWAALLLNGTFYAEVPEASVGLLALAPLAAWAGQIGRLREGGWKQVLAVGLAVAAVAGVAALGL
jgi:hypothetical protein